MSFNNNDSKELETEFLSNEVEEKEEKEEKSKKYIWIMFLVSSVFLFLIVIGLSFSIFNHRFKGDKVPINHGVIFNYTDGDGSNNSVSLNNARDLKDEVGKKLSGKNNFFEFGVSGNTKKMLTKYMILLEKDEMLSNISDSDIKVYLTRLNGSMEEVLFENVPVFSELEDIVIDGKTYKKLYVYTFDEDDKSKFNHDYIFRMWIKENAEDYYEKSYSLKVHIYTEGVGDLCD